MRLFKTGATRDGDKTKPDYEGFYHPLVIEEFGRYMNKHRIQADGEPRDSDNWQQLFGTPEEHRKVCIKSLLRHTLDLWKFHRGYAGRDTIKEALCAIIFNTQAYLFSILLEDSQDKPLDLYHAELHITTRGQRVFVIKDEFLGGVQVSSIPHDSTIEGQRYLCDQDGCPRHSTRQLMYLYEGTKVTTYRCDKHETMPIYRGEHV